MVLHFKSKLKSTPTNPAMKSWSEEWVSQNLIIEKLFKRVPFVVIFIVENRYINEGKNPLIYSYLMLGREIFTPTSMINTIIIALTSIILKSN